MTSILDQIESIGRRTVCDCGGTILTGANGTEQEHDYCDRCDWTEDRADRETKNCMSGGPNEDWRAPYGY